MSITLKGYLQSQFTCSAINYSTSPCLTRSFYLPRYCSVFDLDPCETLKQCVTARIEVFLRWMLKTYNIKKTSTVTTYWRQLSQLYIVWTRCRIEPNMMKQIFVV
jgi:hypothetical protein